MLVALEQFSITVEKPNPKQLLRPITIGAGSAMNQSQFLAITCNSLEAREKSRVHGAIGFGFDSHWLKNWRESFKPITKHSNRNHVISFDGHLKTALCKIAKCTSLAWHEWFRCKGREWKIYCCRFASYSELSRRHLADYVKNYCTKKSAPRAARLFFRIQPTISLTYGVVVVVVICTRVLVTVGIAS